MGVLLCLLLVVNGGEFREEVHSSFQMAVSSSWFEGVIRGLDRHLGEEGLSFVPWSSEDVEEKTPENEERRCPDRERPVRREPGTDWRSVWPIEHLRPAELRGSWPAGAVRPSCERPVRHERTHI